MTTKKSTKDLIREGISYTKSGRTPGFGSGDRRLEITPPGPGIYEDQESFMTVVAREIAAHGPELRSLGHSYAKLDANARYLIARIAVAAVVDHLEFESSPARCRSLRHGELPFEKVNPYIGRSVGVVYWDGERARHAYGTLYASTPTGHFTLLHGTEPTLNADYVLDIWNDVRA